jgi:GTP-binding protein LepA
VGVMEPHQTPVTSLRAGEVGYICGSIKDVQDARVGDTITLASEFKSAANEISKKNGNKPIQEIEGAVPVQPLPGYSESVPMVYCGLFPVDADDYENLRDSLGKLMLNDAALNYEPETSGAMGFGFRCGFLVSDYKVFGFIVFGAWYFVLDHDVMAWSCMEHNIFSKAF